MRRIAGLALLAIAGFGLVHAVVGSASGSSTTLQDAINATAAGGSVVIPDGSYPSQTINSSKSGTITLIAQDPGQVQVAGLTVNADHLHFIGIVAAGAGESRGSLSVCGSAGAGQCAQKFTDLVFDGFRGKSAFIRASNVTVIRSEFGNANACQNLSTEDAFRFWGGSGVNVTPDGDKLIDSVIHDWAGGNNGTCDGTVSPTPHLDCMQNQGGTNMLIQGDTFYGCPSSDIQMEPFSGSTIGNVTVDLTYLGQTACCNSIVLGSPVAQACPGLKVTNSVYFKTPNTDKCTGEGNSGNLLCSSTGQQGCAVPVAGGPPVVPPPTTTVTTATTDTTPTTTTTTTTGPPPYAPACAPTCDEQITTLNGQVAMLQAQNAAQQTAIANLNDQIAGLQAKIAQAVKDLTG